MLTHISTALHPLIRYQLRRPQDDHQEINSGLRLFWDSVRVQLAPKSEIADLVVHHESHRTSLVEQWGLECVRFSHEDRVSSAGSMLRPRIVCATVWF